MKKVFSAIFLAGSLCLQSGCTGGASGDGNSVVSSNSPTPTAQAGATPAPAGEKVRETPLPEFTSADAALAEGVRQLDANATDKAVEALRQAVRLNPDLAEAHFRLGIAYALIEVQEKQSAETGEATPTPTPAKKGRATPTPQLASEKSFESAVKAYKKFLAKNPKDDAAHFNLGRAYNKLNEDKEAEKSIRQAVKLKPDDTEYQTELGAILIKLAQYDEAVRALKKAQELDPTNLEAEELLEKADAGRKRVDFGKKQNAKNAPPQPEGRPSKAPGPARPRDVLMPRQTPAPASPPNSNK